MPHYHKASGATKIPTLLFVSVVALFSCLAILPAQDFRITQFSISPNGKATLQHSADTNYYYILYRGTEITNIVLAADMAVGTNSIGELTDPITLATSNGAFYRIRRVPLNQPLDSDGDGIDDVYELRHKHLLNPLNPADAMQDPDGDGFNNLQEYRTGTNPAVSEYVAPTAAAPVSPTKEMNITLTGTAQPNRVIRVEGGAVTVTNVASVNGAFSVNVPLQSNRLNRLFISAVDANGNTSTPSPVDIIQDSQPPSLFIDFPADHSVLTTSNTVIAGRVGDMLSGFMGLTVTLNSQPSTPTSFSANVNVGIGNNGTFERSLMPLAEGTNLITVTASDVLGNTVTKTISVQYSALPDQPRLLAVSGDLQALNVHRRLLQPITVKATKADGVTPFVNQLLNFQVTRSDGRLLPVDESRLAADYTQNADVTPSGSMFLQLLTDANGEASAWWTLGGDAGCGNNRVCVSSAGILNNAYFCASAAPALPHQINIGSGNHQKAETGGFAAESLRAWASDSCNGISNLPVTFSIVQGNGKLHRPIADDANGVPASEEQDQEGVSTLTVLSSRTGHAEVRLQLGSEAGQNTIEATYPGNPGLPATFICYGVARDLARPTTLTGLVLDNSSQPIGHALCEIFVPGSPNPVLQTFSDNQGRFAFFGTPAGPVHLFVYGASANSVGTNQVPPNSFPFLTYPMTLIPNAENSLPRPILLPHLQVANEVRYYGTNDLVLTCVGIDGLKMTIKANSMRDARGIPVNAINPVQVSLNQVHHDQVPMPIPDGASPPFAWTLQPARATFDPPIQIEYPNMSGLPAGSIAYFLSFNHDTERFDIVASGHVDEQGATIHTDPDAGLTVAGWGCNCPPYSVTGDCVRECDEGGPLISASGGSPPPPDPGCSDAKPRFVRGSGGAALGNLDHLEISTLVTTENLGTADGHLDPDNFKLELTDRTVPDETDQLTVALEALKPSRAEFSPRRNMEVTLKRVGTSKVFRSDWLRLVVTAVDDGAVADQTLLVSTDPMDAQVEILGQQVRATYQGMTKEIVVGKDVLALDIHVHILSDVPTSGTHNGVSWTLNTIRARSTVQKYVRQFLASANIRPGVVTAELVEPPGNLIAISDFDGNPATGNGGHIKIDIISEQDNGLILTWQAIYQTQIGVTPLGTATDIAAMIRALPPDPPGSLALDAQAFENPARNMGLRHPADILVTDPNGGLVLVNVSGTDATQNAVTPRVKSGFPISASGERLLAHNYGSSGRIVDIFVVNEPDTVSHNGTTVTLEQAKSEPTREPVVNSCFVKPFTVDDIALPTIGTVSHEILHALLDANHVVGDPTQLMAVEGAQGDRTSVNGGRRIKDGSVTFDQIGGGTGGQLNQITRMRQSPLLHP